MTPTRRRRNGGDPHERATGRSDALAARDDGLRDEVGRDLDARHEVAGSHDLAVEDREHLERIDPIEALERRQPDMDDAVGGGEQVDPALGRAAQGRAGARHGVGEPAGGLVFVEIARLEDQDGDGRARVARLGARRRRGDCRQIGRREAPAL